MSLQINNIFGESLRVCEGFYFFVRRIGMIKPPVKLGVGKKFGL